MRVFGSEFGPVGSDGFDGVTVRDYAGQEILCANPRVVEDDIAAECDLGPGSGGNLEVRVSVGGQASPWERLYSYAEPAIENLEPKVSPSGKRVSIFGQNFGTNASHIRMVVDGNVVDPATIVLEEEHTQLSFEVPVGTGAEKKISVILPVLMDRIGNVTFENYTYAQTSVSVKPEDSPFANAASAFTYSPPTIEAVSAAPTLGGWIEMGGRNFGPVGDYFVEGSTIGGDIVCENATVIELNTLATCYMPPGTGALYEVDLQIDGQSSLGVSPVTYSYAAGVVESIVPERAYPDEVVVITGFNFGPYVENVQVVLGDFECRQLSMNEIETVLSCTVQDSKGIDVPVVVNVDGVPGPTIDVVTFTYRVDGCNDPDATNFDPFATDLLFNEDGESVCTIEGCTVQTAYNYLPKANVDDGSCVNDPVTVSMEVKLDFDEFLADREFYETEFETEVAHNLNITADRVNVTGAVPGSTVFSFTIWDDPAYPAVNAAQDLETMVLDGAYESTDNFKLLTMEVEGSERGPIKTKATEPNVSYASIIGVSCGLSFMVVWALCWRRCIVACAGFCCTPKEASEEESLVEVQVYKPGQAQQDAGAYAGGYAQLNTEAANPYSHGAARV